MKEKTGITENLVKTTNDDLGHGDVDTKVLYYTSKNKSKLKDAEGNAYLLEDGPNVLAKIVGDSFKLRIDDRGQLNNPWGQLPQSNRLNRFVSVSKDSFTLYLRFLRTANQRYLSQSTREV